ncbi:hypothetical protein GCM10011519_15540 [Marmoricola endophyticus]|uniref:Uncharacterized protein n=1 Tax=Marmoricola endophyticus TaxID=2040280 RepID=A0A917BJX7_9ACTN|nr:putative Ig domain-containing protein [Marmoricola endophyticus]GGF42586.1 hypothetical protein GCM10011519_15540 [Marmoricola endophyticus]
MKRLLALLGVLMMGLTLTWTAGPAVAVARTTTRPAAVPAADPATPGLVPVSPARLLDTRTTGGMVGAGGTVTVQAAGEGGLPGSGIAAVVVNLTVTGPTGPGFLTAYPTGSQRPEASSVNYAKAQTVANQAIVKVDEAGSFTIYASAGTHVLVDVTGYVPDGAAYSALSPSRVLDTRTGTGAPKAIVKAGGVVRLKVTGAGGVPDTGAGAVVLNVTDTASAGPGFVTAYPDGAQRPLASTLNYDKARTAAGMTIAKVGAGGYVDLYTSATSHLVADVVGWFPTTSDYTALTPTRALDTRTGVGRGGVKTQLKAGKSLDLQITGVNGVPESDGATAPTAVEVTVTATGPKAAGFVTAFPSGVDRPGVSTVNYAKAQTVANSATTGVGPDGRITIYTPAATHVVVDVVGYFSGPATTTEPPAGGYPVVKAITSGNAYHGPPSLSADGGQVLFSEESAVFYAASRAAETGDRQTPAEQTSADNDALRAEARRVTADDEDGGARLRLYDASTGTTSTVVGSPALPADSSIEDYQLSADGRYVVYSYDTYDYDETTDEGSSTYALKRLDRTTGQTLDIYSSTAADEDYVPSSSFATTPDGRFVAYEVPTGKYWETDDDSVPIVNVMLKDLSSSAKPVLVNESGVSANVASIADDGSAVAYGAFTKAQADSYPAGSSKVWSRTSGARVAIPRSSSDSAAQLAPDGDSAVFQDQSAADAVYYLDSWRRSGNTSTKLTSQTELEEYGGEQSTDGRYVVHGVDYYDADDVDEDGEFGDGHPVGIRLWDTQTRRLTTVAGADSYTVGQDDSTMPVAGTISGDGSHVGFLTGRGQVALWGPNPRDPNVGRALEVDESDLPPGEVGTSYSGTLHARGGKAPYTWSVTGLPAGLSLDPSTGAVAGTPSEASDEPVEVTLTDSRGSQATGTVALTVYAPLGKAASATGAGYSCSKLQSGAVACWGGSVFATVLAPHAVSGLPRGATVSKVVAGSYSGCAVLANQSLYCWDAGEEAAYRLSILGTGIVDVTASDDAPCALQSTGVVRCVVYDEDGDQSVQTVAFGGKVKAVSGLGEYLCGTLSTGALRCLYVGYGEPPVTVRGVSAKSFSVGYDGACAVVTGATVRCWDGDDEGSPYAISGVSSATQVATDSNHGCARISTGAVSCWGYNDDGQLGNGTTTDPASPTAGKAVAGLSGASAVAAGDGRSCALLSDGGVRCWGAAPTGDGTARGRPRPVRVLALG